MSISENQVLSLKQVQVSDEAKEIQKSIPRKDPRIIEIMLNLVDRDLSRLDIKKNYIGCRLENGLKLTSGGIDKNQLMKYFSCLKIQMLLQKESQNILNCHLVRTWQLL